MGSARLLLLSNQRRKLCGIAGRKVTDVDQAELVRQFLVFRRELGREPIETGCLYRAEFPLQRPFILFSGMPDQRPEIGNVAKDWWVVPGLNHRSSPTRRSAISSPPASVGCFVPVTAFFSSPAPVCRGQM